MGLYFLLFPFIFAMPLNRTILPFYCAFRARALQVKDSTRLRSSNLIATNVIKPSETNESPCFVGDSYRCEDEFLMRVFMFEYSVSVKELLY